MKNGESIQKSEILCKHDKKKKGKSDQFAYNPSCSQLGRKVLSTTKDLG